VLIAPIDQSRHGVPNCFGSPRPLLEARASTQISQVRRRLRAEAQELCCAFCIYSLVIDACPNHQDGGTQFACRLLLALTEREGFAARDAVKGDRTFSDHLACRRTKMAVTPCNEIRRAIVDTTAFAAVANELWPITGATHIRERLYRETDQLSG